MPYASQAQSRFVHWKAGKGVAWAKKFVEDSHGTNVKALPARKVKHKIGKAHGMRGQVMP